MPIDTVNQLESGQGPENGLVTATAKEICVRQAAVIKKNPNPHTSPMTWGFNLLIRS